MAEFRSQLEKNSMRLTKLSVGRKNLAHELMRELTVAFILNICYFGLNNNQRAEVLSELY